MMNSQDELYSPASLPSRGPQYEALTGVQQRVCRYAERAVLLAVERKGGEERGGRGGNDGIFITASHPVTQHAVRNAVA